MLFFAIKNWDVFSLLGDNHPSLNPFAFIISEYEDGAVVPEAYECSAKKLFSLTQKHEIWFENNYVNFF